MPKESRVISLMDMDCFYVQVERHKNPDLVDKPLILCQHGSKTGLPLSISYEARKFGIKRNMNINESKKLCPELQVAFVPQMEGLDKGDLTCYKEASDSIFDVIFNFCSNIVIEKASVDEAFFDLTAEVDQIMADENFKSLLENPDEKIPELLPSTFTIFPDKSADVETSDRGELMKSYIERCKQNHEDMKLLAGAYFMERLRKEIFEKTNYHCSAGIYTNKMMAKLVASRHKPKAQTILPSSECIKYLDQVEIQSVRWFGGKFGKELVETFNIKHVGQIAKIQKTALISAFPDDYLRIINLSNGVCNEDVVERFMPKSISVAKILYNVEKEKIMEWAQGLLGELLRRLEMDQNKFSRTAQHIDFGLSFANRNIVHRSFNISSYAYNPIYKQIMKIIVAHYGTNDESKWTPGPSYISFNATRFGPLTKLMLMSKFMTKKIDLIDSDDVKVIHEINGQQKKAPTTDDQEALPSKKKAVDTSKKALLMRDFITEKPTTSTNEATEGLKVKSSKQQRPSDKSKKEHFLMDDFMKDKSTIESSKQQKPSTSSKSNETSKQKFGTSSMLMDNFMKENYNLLETDDIEIIDEPNKGQKTKHVAVKNPNSIQQKRKLADSSKKVPVKKLRKKKKEAKSTTEAKKQATLNFNGFPTLAQQPTISTIIQDGIIELSSDSD